MSNDRAALMLMDYPNRRPPKIYAQAELRDLKVDTDLARRLASPGYKGEVERAVLLRLELPAAHLRARRELIRETENVAYGCRAEGVDRLHVVADDSHALALGLQGQQIDD